VKFVPDEEGGKERRMAMSLDACGWSKVGVDFGVGLPLAHNKICALEGEVRQATAPTATVVGTPVQKVASATMGLVRLAHLRQFPHLSP
jgi:hypothetical protein